jgi:prepilin-type N-terminal cleavage/methylation domain-containing protein
MHANNRGFNANNRGFTLIELLIVCSIVSIVSLVSVPGIASALGRLGVHSAKQEVASYLSHARALAIQNGRAARFIRNGNDIQVALDDGSGGLTPIGTQDLYELHGVALSTEPGGRDTVLFDPRGLVVGNPSFVLVVTRDELRDSVCVVGLGRIATDGCGPTP